MTTRDDNARSGTCASLQRRFFRNLPLFLLVALGLSGYEIFHLKSETSQLRKEVSESQHKTHSSLASDQESDQEHLYEVVGAQNEQPDPEQQEQSSLRKQNAPEENENEESEGPNGYDGGEMKEEKQQEQEQEQEQPRDARTTRGSNNQTLPLSPPTASTSFVEHPHKMIGMGNHARCVWKTSHTMTKEEIDMLLGNDSDEPSQGQLTALEQGVCVPTDSNVPLHLYSRNAARWCLANKKVLFVGSDYSIDVYKGLREIIFPIVPGSQDSAAETIPVDIQWVCREECRAGVVPWMHPCSSCVNEAKEALTANNKNSAGKIVKGGHSYKDIVLVVRPDLKHLDFGLSAEEVSYQLYLLQKALAKSVLLSPPARPSKNPVIIKDGRAGSLYSLQLELMAELLSTTEGLPFVDIFQAELACQWKNCTIPGTGTTSGLANVAFVNRWKAQLFLNSVCDRDDHPVPDQQAVNRDKRLSRYRGWTTADFTKKAFPEFQKATDRDPKRSTPKPALTPKFAVSKQKQRLDTFSYVPFPHRNIGSPDYAACQWTELNESDERAKDLLSFNRDTKEPIDIIQSTVLKEGLCLPNHNGTEYYIRSTGGTNNKSTGDSASLTTELSTIPPLRIFSASQARRCLANVTFGMGGDSYTRNMFIDLGAILLGRPSDIETVGGRYREALLDLVNHELRQLHQLYPNEFPNVQWICKLECYGMIKPFHSKCSQCVNNFRKQEEKTRPAGTAIFIGSGIHIKKANSDSLKRTVKDIQQFWQEAPGVQFATPVSYETRKIPEAFRNSTAMKGTNAMYYSEIDAAKSMDGVVKLFDYFHLTRACSMDRCSADGGHRARFVNRWKAQLLLNTLCG